MNSNHRLLLAAMILVAVLPAKPSEGGAAASLMRSIRILLTQDKSDKALDTPALTADHISLALAANLLGAPELISPHSHRYPPPDMDESLIPSAELGDLRNADLVLTNAVVKLAGQIAFELFERTPEVHHILLEDMLKQDPAIVEAQATRERILSKHSEAIEQAWFKYKQSETIKHERRKRVLKIWLGGGVAGVSILTLAWFFFFKRRVRGSSI